MEKRNVLKKIMLLAGILLIADSLLLAFKTNINAGTALTFMSGAVLMVWSIWYKKIAEMKGILKLLKYMVLAAILFTVGMIAFLVYQGHSDSVTCEEDAVIVPGAAVHGKTVSHTLAYRLDKAAEYAKKNPKAIIVVSGGKGPQEEVTEASAMKNYLINKGISEEKILKEENATSTYENFRFSKELLDSQFKRGYTCVYTTSAFHLYRAGEIAKQAGIKAEGQGSKVDWYTVPSVYLREVLAVMKFWILKR